MLTIFIVSHIVCLETCSAKFVKFQLFFLFDLEKHKIKYEKNSGGDVGNIENYYMGFVRNA